MKNTQNPKGGGHKGFTLAEVLITLAIIGVVAALTIPTLIANYQKSQYVTQLKKSYTNLTNGFHDAMAREGVFKLSDTILFQTCESDSRSSACVNELSKYFSIIKTYTTADNVTYKLKCLGNVTCNMFLLKGVSLSDGTYLQFTFHLTSSGKSSSEFKAYASQLGLPSSNLYQIAGNLDIDVNGPKKEPNRNGRDYFKFYIGDDGNLYPNQGADYYIFRSVKDNEIGFYQNYLKYPDGSMSCNSTNNNSSGYSCAARIMEENWEMTY